jgi:hypothetical protein
MIVGRRDAVATDAESMPNDFEDYNSTLFDLNYDHDSTNIAAVAPHATRLIATNL